jgi:hypothetical protein
LSCATGDARQKKSTDDAPLGGGVEPPLPCAGVETHDKQKEKRKKSIQGGACRRLATIVLGTRCRERRRASTTSEPSSTAPGMHRLPRRGCWPAGRGPPVPGEEREGGAHQIHVAARLVEEGRGTPTESGPLLCSRSRRRGRRWSRPWERGHHVVGEGSAPHLGARTVAAALRGGGHCGECAVEEGVVGERAPWRE